LLRPETDRSKGAVILPGKLAEKSTMPLRKNSPRKNLHAGNPRRRDVGLAAIRAGEFAGIHAGRRQPLGERVRRVIALRQRLAGARLERAPQVVGSFLHRIGLPSGDCAFTMRRRSQNARRFESRTVNYQARFIKQKREGAIN
jgi:hypothetical protein